MTCNTSLFEMCRRRDARRDSGTRALSTMDLTHTRACIDARPTARRRAAGCRWHIGRPIRGHVPATSRCVHSQPARALHLTPRDGPGGACTCRRIRVAWQYDLLARHVIGMVCAGMHPHGLHRRPAQQQLAVCVVNRMPCRRRHATCHTPSHHRHNQGMSFCSLNSTAGRTCAANCTFGPPSMRAGSSSSRLWKCTGRVWRRVCAIAEGVCAGTAEMAVMTWPETSDRCCAVCTRGLGRRPL